VGLLLRGLKKQDARRPESPCVIVRAPTFYARSLALTIEGVCKGY
jgi:hypothetical protein